MRNGGSSKRIRHLSSSCCRCCPFSAVLSSHQYLSNEHRCPSPSSSSSSFFLFCSQHCVVQNKMDSFFCVHVFFFFRFIYSFITYKYTVAVFRYTGRGNRISLQMVVSHHVVAGNWTQDLWKSSQVLLTAEPSLQPPHVFFCFGIILSYWFGLILCFAEREIEIERDRERESEAERETDRKRNRKRQRDIYRDKERQEWIEIERQTYWMSR